MNGESMLSICQEYCTGCGLCASVNGTPFKKDEKGFLYPELRKEDQILCETVCPAAGNAVNNYMDGTTWGTRVSCFIGWSTNEDIRYKASSGGALTALCVFLLDNGLVDGIIQVKRNSDDQTKTVTVVSTSKEEVLACAGSRYTTSAPLMDIKNLNQYGKKYAFVGKPCDVSALRMYQLSGKEKWTEKIQYMFSFFCAGQPSEKANMKLLKELGCNDVSVIQDLSYRGNGWPGLATIIKHNGEKNSMDYEKSWMTILGRDVRKCCRFCADGTGELADISCGDAWYTTSEGKPDFIEAPGRNVIFARTGKGNELLNKALLSGSIEAKEYDPDSEKLLLVQPYHYNRKSSLSSLKVAMTLCGRKFPLYGNKKLAEFAAGYSIKNKVLRMLGTMKRVWSKSI